MKKITRYQFQHFYIFLLLNLVTLSFSWAQSNLDIHHFSSVKHNHTDEAIGYRLLSFIRTTSTNKNSNKLIPVSLWYPCTKTSKNHKNKMSFKYYVEDIKQGQSFADNKILFTRMLNSYGAIDSIQKEALISEFLDAEIPLYASPEYPKNKYPLVLICGAHPIYHTSLAEAIARQGFVVASFPRLGIKKGERLPFNQQGGIEYQKDLAFVIATLSDLAFIDANRLSFVAWSFEGIPALETALSNKNTQLFVSFDSSLGYQYGNSLSADSTILHHATIGFPLRHYTSSSMDHGKELSLLLQMQKHSNTITIDDTIEMTHAEFTSIGSVIINHIKKETTNVFYDSLIKRVIKALKKTTPQN